MRLTNGQRPNGVLEVQPEASALMDLMVELGHLEEPLLSEVNDRLLDLDSAHGIVGLDDVRRIAAQVVFEHQDELEPEQLRLLRQEWGFLFG